MPESSSNPVVNNSADLVSPARIISEAVDTDSVDLPISRSEEHATFEWSSTDHQSFLQSWREMIQEIYQFRELLWQMVLRDLRIRYKQAIMGIGWAILMPLVIVAAGCLVKIALAHAAGNGVELPRIAGMSLKALGWAFFAGAVGFAANSLVSNMSLVTKVYFPRELFPLSAVITQLIDTLVGTVFLAALLMIFARVTVSPTWVWVPLLLILLSLLTLACSLLVSCGNVFFRDVKYIVHVLLTFGIFFTPVFYEPEFFGAHGAFLMMLNPISPLLEGLRLAVVEHHNLYKPVIVSSVQGVEYTVWHFGFLVYAAIWAVGGLVFSWWLFHRLESVFAEYV